MLLLCPATGSGAVLSKCLHVCQNLCLLTSLLLSLPALPAWLPACLQFPDRPMNPTKLGKSMPNRLVLISGDAASPAVQVGDQLIAVLGVVWDCQQRLPA